jgi:hypothetical protein
LGLDLQGKFEARVLPALRWHDVSSNLAGVSGVVNHGFDRTLSTGKARLHEGKQWILMKN